MLIIYTEELFFKGRLKRFVKKILGREMRGPVAVERSLRQGLSELGTEFQMNDSNPKPGDIACVLNGVKTLHWVLDKKRADAIAKIVAGPNIVVTPEDHGKLILSPLIDAYIVPAQWSIDWWVGMEPEFREKLKLWPAGVQDLGTMQNPQGHCLVYKKNIPEQLFTGILKVLGEKNLKYRVFKYGHFTHEEYMNELRGVSYMLYLSEHESQGLALHEAWMGNVPTLVWNRGGFTYKGDFIAMENVAAPYLTGESGMEFRNAEDFEKVFSEFLEKLPKFTARQYSLENFTDKKAAEKLISIIKQIS